MSLNVAVQWAFLILIEQKDIFIKNRAWFYYVENLKI